MEDPSQKILRKRKPFRLLAKMGRDEIKGFRHFLESPLAQSKPDQKLIQFFDHCNAIQLWHSELDKSAFQKSTGLQLTDNAFDKLVSKLYIQLTTYAGLTVFLETDSQHLQFALKFYEKKNFEHTEIGKKVREGKRELSQVDQNETYFRMMLDLELESAERSKSRTQTPEERGLPALHSYLDQYYFIMKLRFLCASENERRIFGDSGNDAVDELLTKWLQASYPGMSALAKVYYHALHILKGIDDDVHAAEFHQLFRSWEAASSEANSTEFAELNGYLLNYYLRKLNSGDLDALRQVHRFYSEALDKGWVLEDGKISPEHFKNILVIRCRMNLVAEARAFYGHYKDLLSDDQGAAALDYNEAVLEFHEGKFKALVSKVEALVEAKGSIKADQFYGLDLRCLLLKTYFECLSMADWDQWDSIDERLQSLLHAFPAYIARKNLPRTTQLRFDNFRKSLHRLYTIAYGTPISQQAPKMKELLREFRSSSNLPDKGWFIQKTLGHLHARHSG